MTFTEWLMNQFASFNVLLFVVIVLFNYITTTASINKQMKDQKLYHHLDEIKQEIQGKKD